MCISIKHMCFKTNALQLIHHTIGNFNIQPDKLAVSRINESLSTLQQARDLRLREAENSLKSMSFTPQSQKSAQYRITFTIVANC